METTIRFNPKPRRELKRFFRFAVVGLSGTLLDFIVLNFLKIVFGLPTLPANVISYSCGIINNYFLNRFWTYAEVKEKNQAARFWQFTLVSLLGLLLNNLLMWGLEKPFGLLLNNPAQGYLPAKIVATAVVVFWNYYVNRYWTFKDADAPRRT